MHRALPTGVSTTSSMTTVSYPLLTHMCLALPAFSHPLLVHHWRFSERACQCHGATLCAGHASPEDWVVDRYSDMSKALNKTGRSILFSIVGWGVGDPWKGWGPEVRLYLSWQWNLPMWQSRVCNSQSANANKPRTTLPTPDDDSNLAH